MTSHAFSSFKNDSSLRIIILGYIIRGPIGGMCWEKLNYILGLKSLGHDVYFIEDSDDYASCYDPSRHVTDKDPSYGINFIQNVFHRYGLSDRWAYYDAHKLQWLGPLSDRVLELAKSSDLLINLGGANPIRPWFMKIPKRVLVDTDPLFTQIRHITDPAALERAALHTDFFTIGENINNNEANIPNDGFPWQITRQPIFLDEWPQVQGQPLGKFTTVMQWESYSPLTFNGKRYGQKSDSFGPFLDIPSRSSSSIELAIGGSTAPRELLLEKGWGLIDPLAVSQDPWTYRNYIHQSKAEFSVTKHGYVISKSGWFSERSCAYLASGRPVVIQETGFSDWLDTDSGVIPFNTLEEAIAGVESVNQNYEIHSRVARSIAEDYFDAHIVLPKFLGQIMATSQA